MPVHPATPLGGWGQHFSKESPAATAALDAQSQAATARRNRLAERLQQARFGNTPASRNAYELAQQYGRPSGSEQAGYGDTSGIAERAKQLAEEHGRLHGATVADRPGGSGNPLGGYPGAKPTHTMIGGHAISNAALDSRSVEERMAGLLREYGPLVPRGDGAQVAFSSRASIGEPGRSAIGVERRDDGGVLFRGLDPVSPERRKLESERRAMRRLAGQTGLPIALEGEDQGKSLDRLRAAMRGRRFRQSELSRASRLARTGNPVHGQAAENIMRDLRRSDSRKTGESAPKAPASSADRDPVGWLVEWLRQSGIDLRALLGVGGG
ncbi:MAG: hypothetical protein WD069_07150 [Planctomycetales bacterium]